MWSACTFPTVYVHCCVISVKYIALLCYFLAFSPYHIGHFVVVSLHLQEMVGIEVLIQLIDVHLL